MYTILLAREGGHRPVARFRASQEGELVRRFGLIDEVPLGEVAPKIRKKRKAGLILDSLGHDAQSERVSEVDYCANELRLTLPLTAGQRRDERAIELELSHRKSAEIGKGGESCPEIVD